MFVLLRYTSCMYKCMLFVEGSNIFRKCFWKYINLYIRVYITSISKSASDIFKLFSKRFLWCPELLWSVVSSLGFLPLSFCRFSFILIFQVILVHCDLLAFNTRWGILKLYLVPSCSGLVIYFLNCYTPIYLWVYGLYI